LGLQTTLTVGVGSRTANFVHLGDDFAKVSFILFHVCSTFAPTTAPALFFAPSLTSSFCLPNFSLPFSSSSSRMQQQHQEQLE
jgi:hypothetical protein